MTKKMSFLILSAFLICVTYSFGEVVFVKEIIEQQTGTSYYGVGYGDANPTTGSEIYAATWNSGNSLGSIREFDSSGSSWSSGIDIDTDTVAFYDIDLGDVIDDPNMVVGLDEIYSVRADQFSVAYFNGINTEWTIEQNLEYKYDWYYLSPYTPEIAATLTSGCVAVGDAKAEDTQFDITTHDKEAWFGAPDRFIGLSASTNEKDEIFYKSQTFIVPNEAVLPYDIAVGDLFELLPGDELISTSHYLTQVMSWRPSFTNNFTNGWADGYPLYHFRSVAIGDFRPETVNDPNWVGNEMVRGATLDNGWPPSSDTVDGWMVWLTAWGDNSESPFGVENSTFEDTVIFSGDTPELTSSRIIRRIATGDIDGDGYDDIIIVAHGTMPMLAMISWNNETLSFDMNVIDDTKQYYDVKVEDIDSDGDLDVIYAAEGELGILYTTVAYQGDINKDGAVNAEDLEIFVQGWASN